MLASESERRRQLVRRQLERRQLGRRQLGWRALIAASTAAPLRPDMLQARLPASTAPCKLPAVALELPAVIFSEQFGPT